LPNEITCIKYGLFTELPVSLRNLENTDPLEGIYEENVCIDYIPRLSIHPNDSDEDSIVE